MGRNATEALNYRMKNYTGGTSISALLYWYPVSSKFW